MWSVFILGQQPWDQQFINLICIWHVMWFPQGEINLSWVRQMKTWGTPHFGWGSCVRHMAVSPDERPFSYVVKLPHSSSRVKPPPCKNPAEIKGHCPSCQSKQRSANRGLGPSVGWNRTTSLYSSCYISCFYCLNKAAYLEWGDLL